MHETGRAQGVRAMDIKDNRPAQVQGQSSIQNKDTNNNRIKRHIRTLFREGGKYTAVQLNQLAGFNDARKVISDLRHKESMNIKDVRLDNMCKLYWLEPDSQLDLFNQEGGL